MENRQLSDNAKNIVNQAQNWSFEGDCMLLQWMEQISQNLESRAKATTEALDKVTKSLVRSQIALENTQNSLNALQFTQYVEMRCQEDESPVETENTKVEIAEKPKKDILKVFLQNNLNMLHNCHDKFNFVDDSEEDDIDNVATTESSIYQPRNPYNERLLPHIYGTRMWKENWHIGLCEEGEQNYSGDETSDVYSLSSCSSGEHESIESHNTENLSQWTSSVSLNNESSNNNNKTSSNYMPATKTNSSTLNLPIPQTMHIPQSTQPIVEIAKNIEKETVENLEPAISTDTANRNKHERSHQRKTLNLFDDNDFKSLLSEVTVKAQAKQHIHQPQNNIPAHRERVSTVKPKEDLFASGSNRPVVDNPLPSVITVGALPQSKQMSTQKIPTVNLFDSPTDEFPYVKNFEQSKTNSKMDLFADVESYPTDAALETPSKIHKKTMISAKSLFDDDDDDGDEDFLNMFGKSKPSGSSKQSFTTAMFDDNIAKNDFNFQPKLNEKLKEFSEEPFKKDDESSAQQTIVAKSNTVQNKKSLFLDDSEDDENDFIFAKAKDKVKNTSSIFKQDVYEDFGDGDIFNKIPSPAPRNDGVGKKESSKPLFAYMSAEPPEDIEDQHEKSHQTRQMGAAGDGAAYMAAEPQTREMDAAGDGAAYMSAEPPEDIEDQHEKSHQTREIDAAGDGAAYMAAEPPEDIEDQHEKQQSKTTQPKEVYADVEDDDFFSFLPNSKSKVNTKHNIFDSADLYDSEKAENLDFESNTTELGTEDSHTTIRTNSSLNDKKVVLGTESLVKELRSTLNVISQEVKEPQEVPTAFKKTSNERGEQYNAKSDFPELEISKEISQPAELGETEVTFEDANKDAAHIGDVSNVTTYDYSPLFLDEPPDDDFFQVISGNVNVTQTNLEHDFFEPTTSKQKVSETKAEDPTLLHSTYGIGLFSDIPPEDEESTEEIRNTADNKNSKVASNLDLATPVDIFEKIPTEEKDERVYQVVSKPKNVLSKLKPSKETTTDIPPKTSVSKLKMPSININVQALLPNPVGKPKIDKTSASANTADNIPSPTAIPILTKNENLQKELGVDEVGKNLLPNLCKNRVRGPLNRKASTRAGRQESYRKSLENEQRVEDEEQAAENIESIYRNPLNVPILEENSSSNKKSSHSNLKNIHAESFEASSTKREPTSTHLHQKSNTESLIGAGSNLFEEFDETEENDDFLNSFKQQGAEKVEQKSLANAQKPRTTNSTQTHKQKASVKPQMSAGSNLFEEFDETEENDDFLSSFKQQGAKKVEQKLSLSEQKPSNLSPTQAKEQKAVTVPLISAGSSLFEEFDETDENDDFLSSLKQQGAKKVEQKSSTIAQKSSPINSAQPHHQKAPVKSQTSASSNLFNELNETENSGDSQSILKRQVAEKIEQKTSTNSPKSSTIALESDDDLFAQSSGAIQKPIQKVSSQPTSRPKNASQSKNSDALFGSDSNDDDEDDDLFRALSKPKMPIKVSASGTGETKESNKSLFSDSEDDDDLFGNSATKTKKVADSALKVTAAVKKNTNDSKLLTEKTKSTAPTTSDNPLADLLNS